MSDGLTITEAAHLLKVTPHEVKRAIRKKTLEVYYCPETLGPYKRLLIKEESLKNFKSKTDEE